MSYEAYLRHQAVMATEDAVYDTFGGGEETALVGNSADESLPQNERQSSNDLAPAPAAKQEHISFLTSAYVLMTDTWMNILLIFVIPALGCYYGSGPDYLTFILSVIALAPLAERLSFVTEQVCIHTNDTAAGLMNVTFGNATELIVGIISVIKGLKRLLQLSLLGSILSNSLLVLGSSFLASGAHYKSLKFHSHLSSVNSTLLMFSAITLILPTIIIDYSETTQLFEIGISRAISFILLVTYASLLFFQVSRNQSYFAHFCLYKSIYFCLRFYVVGYTQGIL